MLKKVLPASMKDIHIQVRVNGARSKMNCRRTAITIGVGAATAAGLSLLKVNKEVLLDPVRWL